MQNHTKDLKEMTETLANGYSSESTGRELSNEYQLDRVYMVFKIFCVLVLWTKVALALEVLKCALMFGAVFGASATDSSGLFLKEGNSFLVCSCCFIMVLIPLVSMNRQNNLTDYRYRRAKISIHMQIK